MVYDVYANVVNVVMGGGQSFVPLVNIQTGASHFCSSLSCGDISILAALDTKAKPPTRVTAMESEGDGNP